MFDLYPTPTTDFYIFITSSDPMFKESRWQLLSTLYRLRKWWNVVFENHCFKYLAQKLCFLVIEASEIWNLKRCIYLYVKNILFFLHGQEAGNPMSGRVAEPGVDIIIHQNSWGP